MRVWAVKGTNVAPRAARSRPRRPYSFLARTTMLRPSGVSSASDANCAASASSATDTPEAGTNSVAWRLPRVMVPVLSSSNTSTSPAASTARPDMATTLALPSRFMPAMPMAESRAPMVVGARHTRRATRMVIETTLPVPAASTLYCDMGRSETTTIRKMMVSAASRILRAISLGVFCLFAPSTMAIMRSRNVSPGCAVTRTISRSESTRVPPVTALRSPPLSRITGALSPVMALSSTEAAPTITSPSAGMNSPASTSTRSPRASAEDDTCSPRASKDASASRVAITSLRALRRLSA